MKKRKTYRVHVLGCKVNQYEASQIKQLLLLHHWMPADLEQPADIVIVHSCAVTQTASSKSRQLLRKLHKKNPDALLIMTGCNTATPDFKPTVEQCITLKPDPHWLSDLEQVLLSHFPSSSTSFLENVEDLYSLDTRTRAFLKIQDGCDMRCSYCIVPSLRGASRDKPIDLIIHEAQALLEQGYQEIVLTGISIGLYGLDANITLARVLKELVQLPTLKRLRMSSLHPQEITDELLELWAASNKIMPHIHLPLQSGAETILKSMKRGYSPKQFLTTIERFRRNMDRPAFTTDIITGFPGETDADFQQTMDLTQQCGFSKMHVFPYSPRPGTIASDMPNQIPPDIARNRAKQLQIMAADLTRTYIESFVGNTEEVLVEKVSASNQCSGCGTRYFSVSFQGNKDLQGKIVPVRITEKKGEYATGVQCRATKSTIQ